MIIDDKVAKSIIHHANHMDFEKWVPKEILDLEFNFGAGVCRMSIKTLLELQRDRIQTVAKYLVIGMEKTNEKST